MCGRTDAEPPPMPPPSAPPAPANVPPLTMASRDVGRKGLASLPPSIVALGLNGTKVNSVMLMVIPQPLEHLATIRLAGTEIDYTAHHFFDERMEKLTAVDVSNCARLVPARKLPVGVDDVRRGEVTVVGKRAASALDPPAGVENKNWRFRRATR